MLRMHKVSLRAGSFQLKDLSLEIGRGEFHVLLGPTGSGKTLILETLAGLHPIEEGKITLENRDITTLVPEERGLIYVPQDLALFPHMTAWANIEYGLKVRRRKHDHREEFLDFLIRVTAIQNILDRSVLSLSGGERQRVALVRALAVRPTALLLDEPLSALHPTLRWNLRDLLHQLHEELGLTILMVTHDGDDAATLGQRVTVLLEGNLFSASSLKKLETSPPTENVARFLGLTNLFPGRIKECKEQETLIESADFGVIRVKPASGSYSLGQDCLWGIAERDVTIIKPDRTMVPRTNVLHGTVMDIFSRGRDILVLFQARDFQGQLRILLPDYMMERLNLHSGGTLSVEIKADKIFLIPQRLKG